MNRSLALVVSIVVAGMVYARPANDSSLGESDRNHYASFVVYPIEKIRPEERIGRESEDNPVPVVSVAGLEREAFITGIYNSGSDLVEVASIVVTAPRNRQLLDDISISLYRVEYIDIEKGTKPVGGRRQTGRWPDPLIPVPAVAEVESGIAAIRFALPIRIPPSENRTVLIDLYHPPSGDPPHPDAGSEVREEPLLVAFHDRWDNELARVNVAVRLLPFDLPADPALVTTFGFSWPEVRNTHGSSSDVSFAGRALHLDYLHQLAMNRIFVYWPARENVRADLSSDGRIRVDWTAFEEVAGRMLDGTLFDDVSRAPAFRFPMAAELQPEITSEQFMQAASDYLREKGWIDRAFYYLRDEPLRRQYPMVVAQSETVFENAPGVRRMATEPYAKQLEGSVEIWCPDVIALGDGIPVFPFFYNGKRLFADWQVNRHPRVYEARRELGEKSWFYTCTSAQIGTYPNFFIDYPAAYHRVIPWLAYRYGFTGILHWNTTYSYNGGGNPWEDQYRFYANGDGNLLYPGTPEHTGLDEHRAVPSLRMIMFREGAEDYEYLSLLSERGGPEIAARLAKTMVRNSRRWERKASEYRVVKEEMIRALLELGTSKTQIQAQ